ncbi:MAG: C-GCAxxG-C-C family protein [Chloroflexota bacterium]|nr:C-GCAxxG-C-C family protein [Chloroflexota bacterium]
MPSNEQLIEHISRQAHENDRFSGCSQAVLCSLQEAFDIGTGEAFKAATVFGGGVSYQGETCGALIGALMALGLVAGRQRMEDTETYRETMVHGADVCRRFRKELETRLGFSESLTSSMCRDIQRRIYGRSFDMTDEADYQAFLEAGGHGDQGCLRVCAIAARVAAEKIIELTGRR